MKLETLSCIDKMLEDAANVAAMDADEQRMKIEQLDAELMPYEEYREERRKLRGLREKQAEIETVLNDWREHEWH